MPATDTQTAAVYDELARGQVAKADAARAFGVTFGGSLLLDAAAAAACVATGLALMQRRRPSPLAALGVGGAVLYATAGRAWMNSWGMRNGEGRGHAVEIDAPPEAVWPWLAQIGQDRGGSTASTGSRTWPAAGCTTPRP